MREGEGVISAPSKKNVRLGLAPALCGNPGAATALPSGSFPGRPNAVVVVFQFVFAFRTREVSRDANETAAFI